MKRQLLEKLIDWKNRPDRKPLILEGARQVGKTYLLKEIFGKTYDNVIYLNFQNLAPEILELFNEGSINPKRLLSQLEILFHEDISPEKTLIFFDEIQEAPRALTSLKYFYEEAPEYHIVAAGSLLGIFIHPDASFPVGKIETLRLEPLNFLEFLEAKGENNLAEHLLENPKETIFQTKLLDNFREYLFVGGMPAVINEWIENHDIMRTENLQREILMNYTRDFSKHADDTLAWRIRLVFESLPAQFAKANEKFVFGLIRSGARARDYEIAIEWLVDAGLVRRVYRVERGDKLPLEAYRDKASFKLYFLDIGLFRCLAGIDSRVIFSKSAIFDEFNGLVAEQFVLQELNSLGKNAYYWTNGTSTAEVDFISQFEDRIIPIEVKSGENVYAKSLKVYREKYEPSLAIRLSLKPYEQNSGLLNIPLYESFLLQKI